ncbi:MAG: hypothetical protein JXR34_00365 [Bacteroidales bacterium]|nr:hypothetical protein [Bacteroidales bacterium]
MKINNYLVSALAVVGASTASVAQANIDITASMAELTSTGTTALTAVGTALIGLAVIAVVFKWVKGAIFS